MDGPSGPVVSASFDAPIAPPESWRWRFARRSRVAIEIFYAQQLGSLAEWFVAGSVRHDRLRDGIAWLRTDWHPGPIWRTVLRRAASLIEAHTDVPAMLLELAIARSIPGTEGAAQPLSTPVQRWRNSAIRQAVIAAAPCSLVAANLALGGIEAGLALLETAITTAAVLRDPIEGEARAPRWGSMPCGADASRAPRHGSCSPCAGRNRRPGQLRARLHHDLALALHLQRTAR